jgi:hypothetical protein
MARTIIALYDHFETAQSAVQGLVDAGFSRNDISLVANDASGEFKSYTDAGVIDDDVKAGEGAGFGAVVGTLVGLGVALIPGVGPVIAAGPLAAALLAGIGAAAGAATGGVVASLVDFGVPEEEAHYYAEGLRRGSTLVSVATSDEHANRVEEILNRYSPIDVDRRATSWRETGWQSFDYEADPYTQDQIARERDVYVDPVTGATLGNDVPTTTGTTVGRARTYRRD